MNMKTPDMPEDPPAPENPAPRRPFNEISVLFPLLALYTVAYLGLTVANFTLQQGLELPEGIMPLYIALLGAYAADKEIRRWLGTPEPPRKGTVFVYLWLLLFLAFYIIHTFRADLVLPRHLLPVCLQVLGIFFGSKASKHVFASRAGRAADRAAEDANRERLIMELFAAKEQVSRQMVESELGIARSSAGRILADMEKRGLIKRQGYGKRGYYVLTSPPAPPDAK